MKTTFLHSKKQSAKQSCQGAEDLEALVLPEAKHHTSWAPNEIICGSKNLSVPSN